MPYISIINVNDIADCHIIKLKFYLILGCEGPKWFLCAYLRMVQLSKEKDCLPRRFLSRRRMYVAKGNTHRVWGMETKGRAMSYFFALTLVLTIHDEFRRETLNRRFMNGGHYSNSMAEVSIHAEQARINKWMSTFPARGWIYSITFVYRMSSTWEQFAFVSTTVHGRVPFNDCIQSWGKEECETTGLTGYIIHPKLTFHHKTFSPPTYHPVTAITLKSIS